MARSETEGAWQAVGAEKRQAVQSLFADIAANYDVVNSALSFRLHHRWRREAVRMLELSPGDTVADICCGTGDFATPLRQAVGPNGRVVGFDFCLPMLVKAQEKKTPMLLGSGDACALPLASASFDGVTVGWGLRNVADLDAALREIRRILKPRGRFVSLDMAKPKGRLLRAVSSVAIGAFTPTVGALFGNKDSYKYLPKSTDRFASRDEQIEAMHRAGFSEARYKDMFFGNICIHWGRA